MTKKADFNAEEWSLLVAGPPVAALLVIAADRGGTLRESMSMGKVYVEARAQHGASELLDEVVNEDPKVDRHEFGSPEELREKGPQRLREAVALLESKGAPEDVEGYRNFILGLAQRVAETHKEGGFLGIGGKEVSEAEQAALDEVKEAVGG